jgi:hypothetical protein
MKTNEEMTQKNIELSAEFSRYLFEHPEVEATLTHLKEGNPHIGAKGFRGGKALSRETMPNQGIQRMVTHFNDDV